MQYVTITGCESLREVVDGQMLAMNYGDASNVVLTCYLPVRLVDNVGQISESQCVTTKQPLTANMSSLVTPEGTSRKGRVKEVSVSALTKTSEPEARYIPKRCQRKNCIVRKKKGSTVMMHRFPRDIETCKEWVRFADNPNLNQRPMDTLWKSHYLCQHHFAPHQYKNKHLIAKAIPLILPPVHPPLILSSSSLSTSSCPSISQSSCTSAAVVDGVHIMSSHPKTETSVATPKSSSSPAIEDLSPEQVPESFTPENSPFYRSTPSPSSLAVVASSLNADSGTVSSQLPEELKETDDSSSESWNTSLCSSGRCHIVEELPEFYTKITLRYLEKEPMYVKWVYDIINGEADQERVEFQTPCKDDKNGFLMIRDEEWDGEDKEKLHLIALPYRPGLLTIRDLRESHLPLLRNIHMIGKEFVKEKYGIPASRLRIFLQYLPSFYHLNVHFTMVDEKVQDTCMRKEHLLSTVINNLILCPNYYELALLQFYVEESHPLYPKFKKYGVID